MAAFPSWTPKDEPEFSGRPGCRTQRASKRGQCWNRRKAIVTPTARGMVWGEAENWGGARPRRACGSQEHFNLS